MNEILIRDIGLQHLLGTESQVRQNASLTAPDIEIVRRFNILENEIDQTTIPKFNEILEDLGLDPDEAKFVEDSPHTGFVNKFDKEYIKNFESITGLDGSLLNYELSNFADPKAISLRKIKPIIDVYFSDNLRRLLLDSAANNDHKMLDQHLILIQKFNWAGDVSKLPSENSLSFRQAYWLTIPLAKALVSIIKRLVNGWVTKVKNG